MNTDHTTHNDISENLSAHSFSAAQYDAIIIGAGAAGLMCAIEAGKRGKRVWLIDHSLKTAEKIRISGGGRCNFTNIHCTADAFVSNNPHFCKSALQQYTQFDFIDLMDKHGIAYHEKKLGQLFCDKSAQQIIDMLVLECDEAGVKIDMGTSVSAVEKMSCDAGQDDASTFPRYHITTSKGKAACQSLVIATGGLSIPKIGATGFGYDIATQFGLDVITTHPALVPLTFQSEILERCKALSGLSVDAIVSYKKTQFREGLLFTHRGLSGPSILQISSYWEEGQELTINMVPEHNIYAILKDRKQNAPKQDAQKALSEYLPNRLAQSICDAEQINGRLADLADKRLKKLGDAVNAWQITPAGTEGYRTAEVTLCGIDTNALSSKTMECKKHAGLFFIGEVVDVTGHLGGYNFQWAWSSGYVAGQNI